jgi:hypothetical protein
MIFGFKVKAGDQTNIPSNLFLGSYLMNEKQNRPESLKF